MNLVVTIYVTSFIKIGSAIEKFMAGGGGGEGHIYDQRGGSI
jgi:hypothetical protein